MVVCGKIKETGMKIIKYNRVEKKIRSNKKANFVYKYYRFQYYYNINYEYFELQKKRIYIFFSCFLLSFMYLNLRLFYFYYSCSECSILLKLSLCIEAYIHIIRILCSMNGIKFGKMISFPFVVNVFVQETEFRTEILIRVRNSVLILQVGPLKRSLYTANDLFLKSITSRGSIKKAL